jgi:hypothetical protein
MGPKKSEIVNNHGWVLNFFAKSKFLFLEAVSVLIPSCSYKKSPFNMQSHLLLVPLLYFHHVNLFRFLKCIFYRRLRMCANS